MLGSTLGAALKAVGGRDVRLDAASSGPTREFWRRVERYSPNVHVEHVSTRDILAIIVSGWACEMRVLPDGRRQIFSILLPGDLVCLRARDNLASVALVALTRLEVAETSNDTGPGRLAPETAGLVEALHLQCERQLDHIVRLGSLTAGDRVIHLLLELHARLDAIGLVKLDTFRIPLTQEVFASVLGTSVVHINRTLQRLRKQGLITLRSGSVTLHDIDRLASIACYQARQV